MSFDTFKKNVWQPQYAPLQPTAGIYHMLMSKASTSWKDLHYKYSSLYEPACIPYGDWKM